MPPKPKPKERKKEIPITQKKTSSSTLTSLQKGAIAGVLLLTFIIYSRALSPLKEFTNWDDETYVSKQDIITKLDGQHIHAIFTQPVSYNYHPLTMLSLAVNYHFSQLNPFGYFLTNIILHLCNTLLVFIFFYLLSGRKFWVGFVTSLLFGIHPMHVESVAWVSERKDLLYCLFFFSSCIMYMYYIETRKAKYIFYGFLFFILSCLSKAMAAPLPLVLLLIDFYKQRKFTWSVIAEKVPFFLVSLLTALYAVRIQSQGPISDFAAMTFAQHIMLSCYGFVLYWAKLFVPVGLSAFYLYPQLDEKGYLPLICMVSPLIALAIVIIPAFVLYQRNKDNFRAFIFGMFFFIVMIAMVIQFISVGSAMMADRYTYLPYAGAFFMLTTFIYPYFNNEKTKVFSFAALGIITVLLSFSSYNRVQVWQNCDTLWSDVIQKYPYEINQSGNNSIVKTGAEFAYHNRAVYYALHGEVDKAIEGYELIVQAGSKKPDTYINLANIYGIRKQYDKSLELFSKAMKLDPKNYGNYIMRGLTYANMGKHQEALNDYTTAIQMFPPVEDTLMDKLAYENLSLDKWDECIADCNKFLAKQPDNAGVLSYRGAAYINTNRYPEAIADFTRCLKLNPSSGEIWNDLSIADSRSGKPQEALDAALNAQKNGFNVSADYLQQLKRGIHN